MYKRQEQLTPYVYYAGKAAPEVAAMSRKMAEQVDVPYMVKSEVASGGSYNYAASCGIPSILIERGGMGSRTMEEVELSLIHIFLNQCSRIRT